jgi:ATP-binding cassette, subfamily D (ALD), member 3
VWRPGWWILLLTILLFFFSMSIDITPFRVTKIPKEVSERERVRETNSSMKMKVSMMRMMGKTVMSNVLRDFGRDRRLVLCLSLAFGGLGAILPSQFRKSSKFKKSKEKALVRKRKPKKVVAEGGRSKKKQSRFQRLLRILKICIPGMCSYEAALLVTQSFVLVSRSLLSMRIARKGGDGLSAVLKRDIFGFLTCLCDFWLCGVTASVVNSALKYLTNCITVSFRERLTRYIHDRYLENRNFYKASVLRNLDADLDNADQRIVDDLQKFTKTASDLFSRTFKPLLDVVLNTHRYVLYYSLTSSSQHTHTHICTHVCRMAENMGYTGLITLYTYFTFSGFIVRAISPPFSRMIAEQQMHEGNFRRLHSRLIANAEEIAFLEGSQREKQILNEQLGKVTAFNSTFFAQQFRQGICDQYFLKYNASMIGWPVLALPFLLRRSKTRDVAEIAAYVSIVLFTFSPGYSTHVLIYHTHTHTHTHRRYRESDTLIQNASSSVGDLLMIYKKVQRLFGYSDRVTQLLEAVSSSSSKSSLASFTTNIDDEKKKENTIRFEDVTIHTPELKNARLLLKSLNLKIEEHQNILVTGANGAGKTSLFRCLAGLWEPTSGTVIRPQNDRVSLFYVPQRPYLVCGTLRDQVTYPSKSNERDADVLKCLEMVGLRDRFASDRSGLDRKEFDWSDVLSGGEQQRIGLARLYFHRPKFAVLDEATSAINADEEGTFYDHLENMGITVFSIAHRLELQRFHQQRLHFLADGTGRYKLLTCPSDLRSNRERQKWWDERGRELLRLTSSSSK